jgi:hypothetical protein
MAKRHLIKFLNYYPYKARKGFTIEEVAKFNHVSINAVRNTVWRGMKNGSITIIKPSKGMGRGRGRTVAVYALTKTGIKYYKYIAPQLII